MAAWQCVRAAVVLIRGHGTFPCSDKKLKAAIRDLAAWIILVTARRGPDQGLKELKAKAAELRLSLTEQGCTAPSNLNLLWRLAVALRDTDWNGQAWHPTVCEIVAQLTYIGRALPAPTEEATLNKAILEHRRALLSGGEPIPKLPVEANRDPSRISEPPQLNLVKDFRLYVRSWASRYGKGSVGIHEIAHSTGASVGNPRAMGGHLNHYIGLMNQNEPGVVYDDPEFVLGHEHEALAQDAILRDHLRRFANGKFRGPDGKILDGMYPELEAVCLATPGVKTRVISKGDEDLNPLAHSIRHILFQALRRDPVLKYAISCQDDEALEELILKRLFMVGTKLRLLSTDLTAATDLILMEFFQAGADGFSDGFGLSDEARELAQLAVGPQRMTWTIKADTAPGPEWTQPTNEVTGEPIPRTWETTAVTNRGSMMGCPITFSLLCLVHRWACERAISLYEHELRPQEPLRGPEQLGFGFKKWPYIIRGDDAGAPWPERLNAIYTDVMTNVGAKFSEGKHYYTQPLEPDGIDTKILWYCEKMYVFRAQKVRTPNGFRIQLSVVKDVAVPMAGIVHLGCCIPQGAGEVDRGYPGWASIGATVASLSGDYPNRTRCIARAILTIHPGLPEWFRSRGFYPYLPRELGGAGLLPWHGTNRVLDLCSREHAKALAILLTDESPEVDWLVFERPWATLQPGRHKDLAAADLGYEIEDGNYRFFRRSGEKAPACLEPIGLPRKDWERKAVHHRSKTYVLMLDLPREEATDTRPNPRVKKGFAIQPTKVSAALKRASKTVVSKWPGVQPLRNVALDKLLAKRAYDLDDVVVYQTIVDRWGSVVEVPEITPLLVAQTFQLPEFVRPCVPGTKQEITDSSYIDYLDRFPDLIIDAVREHYLPPRRYTIMCSDRSNGSVYRQSAVERHYGWHSFLFKEDMVPPSEER